MKKVAYPFSLALILVLLIPLLSLGCMIDLVGLSSNDGFFQPIHFPFDSPWADSPRKRLGHFPRGTTGRDRRLWLSFFDECDPLALERLLENGADANRRSPRWGHPLGYVINQYGFSMTALLEAVENYDYSLINLDLEDVYQKNTAVVFLLVDHGGEIHLPQDTYIHEDLRVSWLSPFSIAVSSQPLELIQYLYSRDPEVPWGITYGEYASLLKLAFLSNGDSLGKMEFLLAMGASLELEIPFSFKYESYYTACIYFERSLKVVELLYAYGEAIDTEDRNGKTPLHHGVEQDSLEIVEFLLSHGADPLREDAQGISPLEWVEQNGSREMKELFQHQQ